MKTAARNNKLRLVSLCLFPRKSVMIMYHYRYHTSSGQKINLERSFWCLNKLTKSNLDFILTYLHYAIHSKRALKFEEIIHSDLTSNLSGIFFSNFAALSKHLDFELLIEKFSTTYVYSTCCFLYGFCKSNYVNYFFFLPKFFLDDTGWSEKSIMNALEEICSH